MKRTLLTALLLAMFAAANAQTAENTGAESTNKPVQDTSHAASAAVAEKAADFPGGIQAFYMYLMRNLRYPRESRERKIQGKVLVSFIVGADGRLTNIKIVKSVSPDIDAEAIRLIANSPAWIPAVLDGRPVGALYRMPISFNLN